MSATLLDRVARLERLAAESHLPSEALVPTFLTLDPATGLVGASFPGAVLLDEASAQPLQPGHAVAWKDAGATIREWVQGYDDGLGFKTLDVTSNPNASDLVRLLLQAQTVPNHGTPARLVLTVQDSNGAGNLVGITVLDSLGSSSFLQLLSAQQLQLAFGSATLTWPGAQPESSQLTIAHGLGRIPKVALGMSINAVVAAEGVIVGEAAAADLTNIYLYGLYVAPGFPSPGAGFARTIYWVALG